MASTIIPLCLPLDVGISAPLANGVRERSKCIISYSIGKSDFLEILGVARDKAITPVNIKKAWKAVGLEPLDPEVVLNNFPNSSPPPLRVSLTSPTSEVVHVPVTPSNVAQVD
jgi:hypothetical protein